MITFSKYIYAITSWLSACRVPLQMYSTALPNGVGGRCYSKQEDGYVGISVSIEVSSARAALLTLAHEAGHWLGNESFGYKKHSYQRERQAKVYGWRVLQLVGAQHLFTRKEWMEFHT